MKKFSLLQVFITLVFLLPCLAAENEFTFLNLNPNDELLFTLCGGKSDSKKYTTLFLTTISQENPELLPLTVFPEKMEYLKNQNALQIRNKFGTALYSFNKKSIEWKKVSSVIPEKWSTAAPFSISPNGEYSCYIQKTSALKGTLVIEQNNSGNIFALDTDADYNLRSVPVKWSPDSNKFVYQKNGSVYFGTADAISKNIQMEEKYRKIGQGSIDSVEWATKDCLVYIDSDLIYKIKPREMVSLGMYSKLIGLGEIAGRLPIKFDSLRDKFCTNYTATEFVVLHENNLLSYYKTNAVESSDYLETIYSRPFYEKGSTVVGFDILMPNFSEPIVCADLVSVQNGKRRTSVYQLTKNGLLTNIFSADSLEVRPMLSSDSRYLSFAAGGKVFVYECSPFKKIAEIVSEKTTSLAWCSAGNLCIGNDNSVSLWNAHSLKKEFLFLSSAKKAWWRANELYGENSILAKDFYDNVYKLNLKNLSWQEIKNEKDILESVSVQNSHYRVLLGDARNKNYSNAILVRSLAVKGGGTFPLIKSTTVEAVKKPRVALTFDAFDSPKNIAPVLSLCEDYGIKVTFFINGHFIKKYPMETKQIAASSSQCASLFFAPIDLTGKDFIYDEDFVRRGLSHVEDEFFSCTGKELSLLWHAPFFRANDEIRSWGKKSGYTYVTAVPYSSDMKNVDGKVISVLPNDGDTLTINHLELVINNLIDAGCEFVFVREIN